MRKVVVSMSRRLAACVLAFRGAGLPARYRARGADRNARIRVKLYQGRTYVLRIRLYWAWATGETAVMMW